MSQIEFYAGAGRPCPHCKRRFQNSVDFQNHKCGDWISKGDYDILPAEKDAELTRQIVANGRIIMGGCEYSLSGNKRWIIRRRT